MKFVKENQSFLHSFNYQDMIEEPKIDPLNIKRISNENRNNILLPMLHDKGKSCEKIDIHQNIP